MRHKYRNQTMGNKKDERKNMKAQYLFISLFIYIYLYIVNCYLLFLLQYNGNSLYIFLSLQFTFVLLVSDNHRSHRFGCIRQRQERHPTHPSFGSSSAGINELVFFLSLHTSYIVMKMKKPDKLKLKDVGCRCREGNCLAYCLTS